MKLGDLVIQKGSGGRSSPWLVVDIHEGDIFILNCTTGNRLWIEERVAQKWYEVVA